MAGIPGHQMPAVQIRAVITVDHLMRPTADKSAKPLPNMGIAHQTGHRASAPTAVVTTPITMRGTQQPPASQHVWQQTAWEGPGAT